MTATVVKNTALVAGAATVTFPARYSYVEFKNESTANPMYVRTDGTAPTVGGDDCYYVAFGERVLLPNCAPLWDQGFGGPAGTSNPGTTVKVAGTSTDSFTVIGA